MFTNVFFKLFLCFCSFNISKCFNQLSFSGGGAFGAVEMGIIKKINELEKKHYDIYTGISVGGLNAGFLSYFRDLSVGIKEGEALYTRLKTRMVYEAYPQTKLSLLNTLPLLKTLTEILNSMPNEPIVNTLIGSTNLYTGNLDIFNFGETDIKERPTLLMATSAIPVMFPPISFKGNMYIDGGTLSNELLDVIHSDSYLNITFITPSNTPNVNTNPIVCLKDVVMRTIQIVTKNFNNPLSKVNQNCKIPYGEINKYFVDYSLLSGYSGLNFDKGQELIDIGYKNMIHEKYMLC